MFKRGGFLTTTGWAILALLVMGKFSYTVFSHQIRFWGPIVESKGTVISSLRTPGLSGLYACGRRLVEGQGHEVEVRATYFDKDENRHTTTAYNCVYRGKAIVREGDRAIVHYVASDPRTAYIVKTDDVDLMPWTASRKTAIGFLLTYAFFFGGVALFLGLRTRNVTASNLAEH